MRLFRIGSSLYPLFDGTGAFLCGGRWNSPGRRVIYAAASLAVAQLEMLVHIGRATPPANHAWIFVDVPDDVPVTVIGREDLPPGWDHPTDRDVAQTIGDAWFARRETAVLDVPSVAAAEGRVFVIAQDHPDFQRMRAGAPMPLVWDTRLFGGN
jgi:RES domain-containing protein